MDDPEQKIQNAEKFARKKHKNQKKRDGVIPYVEHLEGVVNRLKNLGMADPDVICAAWLHDILEKTDAELEELIQRFGKRTATLVLAVSKDYNLSKKEREDTYIKQLKDAPIEAKIIKLCDISSNIKGLADSPLSKTQKNKQIRKILHYLRVIKKEVSDEKSRYPKIQDMAYGINAIAIRFKQRPISI
jgi:(p)ppGpp synthase/HD superfamily hydrolase